MLAKYVRNTSKFAILPLAFGALIAMSTPSANANPQLCKLYDQMELKDLGALENITKQYYRDRALAQGLEKIAHDRICDDLKHIKAECADGDHYRGTGFVGHFKKEYCDNSCTFDAPTNRRC